MPFKSKAQERWMYANDPEMAARWQKDTPAGTKLPERKAKPKAKPFRGRIGDLSPLYKKG